MKIVKINDIVERLSCEGIDYAYQGGAVIRTTRGRSESMHPSIQSEHHAAAMEASRVLHPGECLGKRWEAIRLDADEQRNIGS